MTFMSLDPGSTALFLDVDGTLLEIVDDPGSVVADALLINSLRDAETRLSGALALISGRRILEIDRIFSPAVFTAAGAHGTEFRMPGASVERSTASGPPAALVATLTAFAEDHPGLLIEVKDSAVALHYRRAPELEDEARRRVAESLQGTDDDLRLIDGKMVLEIVPRHHDKGAAIRRLMEHPAFADRHPVFIGDDVTDEDGFAAVNELGGTSVHVGNNQDTRALHSLADVDAVRRWLLDPFAEQRSA